MRKIVWLDEAQKNLEDAHMYVLSMAGPEIAAKVVKRITDAASPLASYPSLGYPSPSDDDVRELVVTGLPYLLPYTVKGQRIIILRVFHDAQQRPGSWIG